MSATFLVPDKTLPQQTAQEDYPLPPTWYMVELTVSNLAESLSWYCDRFRLRLILRDYQGGFALLDAVNGRIALKQGTSQPGTTRLFFEVADLAKEIERLAAEGLEPSTQVKENATEKYLRIFYRDPDGHSIGLFQWKRIDHGESDHR